MKFLEKRSQASWFKAAIIMEEGDYTLPPNQVKGMHVDYIFIPEQDEQYYTEDNPLYQQLISDISIGGIFYGQILTYKIRNAAQL